MDYLEIYNDEYIRNQLYKIDQSNENYKNHGLNHALNVVSNIEKLSKILNISNEELNYLKIAGYLHDIGRSISIETNDHDMKGAEFINKYLINKIDRQWLEKISSAIEKHHAKQNLDTLTLFEHIVLFADKMDFSKARIDKKYKAEDKEYPYFENNVSSVDFAIEDNVFIVLVKLMNNKTKDDFIHWDASKKILKRVEEFADKLGMDYKIKFT